MMQMGEKIQVLRKRKGMSQQELAKAVDVTQQAIQSLERGDTKRPRYMVQLCHALNVDPKVLLNDEIGLDDVLESFGWQASDAPQILNDGSLPIIGKVEAGSFRLKDDEYGQTNDQDYEHIDATPDSRFSHCRQYALQIVGDSVNRKAGDGDFAHCIEFADLGWSPEQAMGKYVVAQLIDGDKYENTVKLLVHEKGRTLLRPDSFNPKYKDIDLTDFAKNNDGKEIHIKAIVRRFLIDVF